MTNPNPLKGFRRFNEPSSSSGETNPEVPNPEFDTSGLPTEHCTGPSNYFCPNCGHPSPGLNLYCGQCGIYIVDPFEAAPPAPASPTYITQPPPPFAPSNRSQPAWLKWGLGGATLTALVLAVIFLNGGNMTPRRDLPAPAVAAGASPTVASQQPANTSAAPLPAAALAVTSTPTEQGATIPARQPTATPRPTRTPTQRISACPGAPKQRLEVGEDARVCTQSDNVYLRSGPSRSHSVLDRVRPGTVVEVIGGPECANDWSYWEVSIPDGTTGWISEGGDTIDPYFLCPN